MSNPRARRSGGRLHGLDFSPRDIDGGVFWHEADDMIGTFTNGNPIGSSALLPNKFETQGAGTSPVNFDTVPFGGSVAPIFNENQINGHAVYETVTINSNPHISSSGGVGANYDDFPCLETPSHIFVICKINDHDNFDRLACATYPREISIPGVSVDPMTQLWIIGNPSTSRLELTGLSIALGSVLVVEGLWNPSALNSRIRVNGSQLEGSITGCEPGAGDDSGFHVGGNRFGACTPAMEWSEVIWYNREITDDQGELTALRSYLATKSGVTP